MTKPSKYDRLSVGWGRAERMSDDDLKKIHRRVGQHASRINVIPGGIEEMKRIAAASNVPVKKLPMGMHVDLVTPALLDLDDDE